MGSAVSTARRRVVYCNHSVQEICTTRDGFRRQTLSVASVTSSKPILIHQQHNDGVASNMQRGERHLQATEQDRKEEQESTCSSRLPGSSLAPARSFASIHRQEKAKHLVSHFMSPAFPFKPTLTIELLNIVQNSWDEITNIQSGKSSTLANFHDLFYKRLRARSSSFIALSSSSMKRKGKVLMSAMRLMTSACSEPSMQLFQRQVQQVGVSHQKRKEIRPWQYSVFAETIVESISSFAEPNNRGSVRVAWSNLVGFTLQQMLSVILKNQTIPSWEFGITSAELQPPCSPFGE